jgi:regulator of sirC expression with transglutaminase-like and TPR domain
MEFSPDLSDLAEATDRRLPIAESALRVALVEYPALDPAPALAEIARLAARARELAAGDDDASLLAAVDAALFAEAGFRGNADAYYDPRNSFLNEVLRRKTGIPITLSVLYLEVGRRLGLDLYGVGFPGHFLVGRLGADGPSFIDPFNSGARLARDECARLLPTSEAAPALDDSYFAPVADRQILLRMLTNLKLIYSHAKDYARAVAAIDRILQIAPDALTEVRDRGLLRMQAGEPRRALPDLERYIDNAPPSPDRDVVVTAVGAARRALARYN